MKKIIYFLNLLVLLLACSATDGNQVYKVSLSIYPVSSGMVRGEGDFMSEQTVEIFAEPKIGFEFSHWRHAGNGEVFSDKQNVVFQATNNLDLVAVFKDMDEKALIKVSEQNEIGLYVDPVSSRPKDILFFTTRYIGDDFIENGVSNNHSGVINDEGKIKMVINTWELESKGLYKNITGGGPHIWLSKRFSEGITPWANDKEYLSLSVNASVPLVELTDPEGNVSNTNFTSKQAPVTQLSFGLYFRDMVNEITFAYIIPMYESRGTYNETANAHDTFNSFVSTPLEAKSKYVTKSPESASLQSIPFDTSKYFEVHIKKENIEKAISDSNRDFSTDISQYQITSAGILFELPNYVKNGHNISVVNLSEFKVKIAK